MEKTVNTQSTLSAPHARLNLRSPKLSNASRPSWERHGQIAYRFARQAKHDMVNIQCSLRLMETMEKIRQMTGDAGLPPELQPDAVKKKTQTALNQLVSMANDMVLLSQAASPAAYDACRGEPVNTLIRSAIHGRLGEEATLPGGLVHPRGDDRMVVGMGDQLQAAIAAFYFQWTPWCHEHVRAAAARVDITEDSVHLRIAADDVESVAAFARGVEAMNDDAALPPRPDRLSITTCEMALWLARFIIELHGGAVRIDPNDPELALEVSLPTTR
jgi:hypothetical protein